VLWDFEFAAQILPALLAGLVVTVQATVLGMALALLVGLALVIGRRAGGRAGAMTTVFVDFVRGTPLLVQLFFIFYLLPAAGLTLGPLVAGVLALGLHYGAYLCEVYRAGIDNVSRGQWEAAKALGLTRTQTWRRVILPQAIPPTIPVLANYAVAMFKETPLLSTITVVELMSQARIVANFNYRYIEPMTLVGLLFLAVSIVSAFGLRRIEHHFAAKVR
jgi:polar amino acid transport system permease protein